RCLCASRRCSLRARRRPLPSFPTRRSSDLVLAAGLHDGLLELVPLGRGKATDNDLTAPFWDLNPLRREILGLQNRFAAQQSHNRSEEHTSELQSRENLVCRLLLEKKKQHAT